MPLFKTQKRPLKVRLPDRLRWAGLIAPGVIIQKDEILQKTVAFRGPDLGSSSDAELVAKCGQLNQALKRLGTGWSFHIEAQRAESADYPSSTWPSPAPWLVDLERRKSFQEIGSHYESSYFITFCWQMPGDVASRASSVFYEDPEADDAVKEAARANARDLDYFLTTVREIVDIMAGVFVDVGELDDDQTVTYLHSTISTNRHPVKAPEVPFYLDAVLPDQPFTAGDIPMLGDHFVCTCTVAAFPSSTMPALLDDLNHLPIPYRWVTRFICLDKEDARHEISLYRKRWHTKRKTIAKVVSEAATNESSQLLDSDASNKAEDADAATQELGADLVGYGYLTATVTVWDRDRETAQRKMQLVKQAIQSRGFTVRDETLNAMEAWFGSLPGDLRSNVRRPLVSTLNLVHLLPLSAVWSGDAENAHLKQVTGVGTAHLYCSTTGEAPFRLNLAHGDVGHAMLVGPTGAGKSTKLCTLALQWLRYPGAQVILLDYDRSARATTLAVGGTYYEPGSAAAPLAFQPLSRVDAPDERRWASEFVMALCTAQNLVESPELKKEIDGALGVMASEMSPRRRTLTDFVELVQDRRIREALRPYVGEGLYAQIFDADDESMARSRWTMIEMRPLMAMGDAALIPALHYLFHRLEERFDGKPTLLVLDEAWKALSHPVFAPRIEAWLRTLRKKNVYIVFATQQLTDIMREDRRDFMSVLMTACQTKIFLPDPEAITPAMARVYGDFGLTDVELRILAGAQAKRDYYYRSPKGRRLFRLDLGPIALALAGASSPEDHAFMDAFLQKNGSADGFLPALLRHRGLDWAAELAETAAASDAPLSS